MSDDTSKTSVNIRVESDVWDSVDGNRSEICRQALRAAAEAERGQREIQKYAREYDELLEQQKRLEKETRVTRQLAFDELDEWNYDQFVLPDGMPDDPSMFEETVVYASQYAESYLDAGRDDVARLIRRDMNQEGRELQRVVAEWIVEQVEEQLDDS